MKLKSFGCSFIFGTDLHDDGRNGSWATPSNHTWPALLARHQDRQYQCLATPGSGNLRILERLLRELSVGEPSLFVVGWTWIDRFDYNDYKERWATLMPITESDLAKTYYKNLHSQFKDKLTSLIYIKTAIDALQQQGHEFIMTYMDNLLFETQWHSNPSVAYLQDYVRPYLKNFQGKTFLEWAKERGYEISPTLHPLEQAHSAAAEYAVNHFLV